MKIIFFLILFTGLVLGANDKMPYQKNELGISLGPASGWGLSYKMPLSDFTSLRFVGGFISSSKSDLNYCGGLEFAYNLRSNRDINFFISNAFIYTYEETHFRWQKDARGVLGLGLSLYIDEMISLTFEYHQVFEYSITEENYEPEFNQKDKDFYFYPSIGLIIGFLY